MKAGFRIFFLLFFCLAFSQSQEDELLHNLKNVSSDERIFMLNIYQEKAAYLNLNEERLNWLFEKLYQISDKNNDKEFRAFLDFYKRVSPTMFIPEKNEDVTHKKMIALYEKALEYYLNEGDNRFAGICLVHMGFDWFMLEDYGSSIECMLRGSELLKKAGYNTIPTINKYLDDMARIFYFFKEHEKVAELLESASQFPAANLSRKVNQSNTLGLAFSHLKQYKNAEKAFVKTIDIAKKEDYNIWIAIGSINLGKQYLQQKRYNEALLLFQNTLNIYDKKIFPKEYTEHLLALVKTYLLLGNTQKAGEYIHLIESGSPFNIPKSHYYGSKQVDEQFRKDYYDVKHLYYKATNDYRKSYLYLDSLNVFKRSQDSIYNSLQINVAEQKLNIQKKLAEIENERKEKKMISARLWSIIMVVAFVSVIFALLYYIARIRRKKENIEHLYREKLMEEEQWKIKKELHHVKEEIKNYLKNIALKNKQIEELSSKLNNLKKENAPQSSDEIKQTEEKLRGLKILTKEQWEIFRNEFEKMQPDFSKKLKKKTSLSEAEIRLLMLSKLHYSGKEIMGILGISDSAVRVTWHRIRKKLDISSEVSPEQVIQKIK